MQTIRVLALLSAVVFASASAQAAATGRFVDRVYRDADGEHKYVVFEPAGYHPSKKWPLIFYLHGASGRGTDGRSPLIVGMGPAVNHRAATLPFLVVFPQCENLQTRLLGGWHEDPHELDRALRILETVEKEYAVERSHEVLVGTSMGGFGVWSLAARDPKRWKAIAPISGGGTDDMIPALAQVPVWAFHAADDTLVPPTRSTELVESIRKAGGRAFVSVLPRGGHNISRSVLARDDVFDWFLHPEREPNLNIDWNVNLDLPNLTDQMPFVPGADVAQAVRVHIGRDLLQSWAALMPGLVPANALSGWKGGTAESTQQGLFRFDVTTGGIQYTGVLEQAWIEPLADNRLRIQMGLRSMQMTISSTHLQGRLLRADAGPMTIYIGYNAPVWLTADLRPRIADRKLHIDIVGVDFHIPPDNWSVSPPAEVRVRGLPFLRNRISEGLVEGVAEKRLTIEAEIRNSVPQMVAQLEAQMVTYLDRTVSFGRWPMPLWQPRLRFYPESLVVSDKGLDITVGAIVAQMGQRPKGSAMMQFPSGPTVLPAAPNEGMEVAVSERVVTAWSALLADSNVARFHVLDMNSAEFRELGQREFWNEALPAIRSLPDDAELQTEFVLLKPLDIRDRQGDLGVTGNLRTEIAIDVPQLRLELSVFDAAEKRLRPYAGFNVALSQGFRAAVAHPTYVRREFQQGLLPAGRPTVQADYLPEGVSPGDVDTDRIAAQFERGWGENFEMDDRSTMLKDMVLSQLPLRWNETGWDGAQLVARWQRPGILIVNGTAQTVEYKVRGLNTPWSDALRLAPRESHEYRPATALMWQQSNGAAVQTYKLSLGEAIELREQGPVSLVPTMPTHQLVGGTR